MYIPKSTYRLQLNASFNFQSVREIIQYLSDLGIGDIYSSPISKAKQGSTHGYDVVEPNLINPEIGTLDEFENLVHDAQKLNLGWLQDIVPNHMAYSYENTMLVDLLENGPNSRYFSFFDIEWNHPYSSVRQRVLAPFLGKFYRDVLENSELKLRYDQEGFSINYYETKLPLNLDSYADVLSFRFDKLRNKLGKNNPDIIKFLGVLYVLKSLPNGEELDERYDQIKFVKGMLWELYNDNEQIKMFVDETVKIYNGETGNSDSFNLLDELLGKQYFRLAFWKVATEEINYRRFFTINELITIKMENEETFNRTHSLMLKLIKDGYINGLRIDHVDGLYDPTAYLNRLRERAKNIYIVVEKIVDLDEDLPSDWNIEGTTGYEFVNYLNGVFCMTENGKHFTNLYTRFTKLTKPYEEIVAEKKRLFIQKRMAGEVERIAFLIESISSNDRHGIDITMHGLKMALEEILTYFPIYRTYINSYSLSKRDSGYIDKVMNEVKEKNPSLINEFNYVEKLLSVNFADYFSEEQKGNTLDFIMKFQQLTGPLMAKGFEDTTLYVYNRFISLNEVGGDPGKFGIKVSEFHEFNRKRSISYPHTMNTTSTHDTKRGEDVRARLNVISELPLEWEEKIKYWSKVNSEFKVKLKGTNFPDKNDEYFLYQTIIGSYPFEQENYINRLKEYVIKAVREAKVHTAWLKPDEEYESAFASFVDNIFNENNAQAFLMDFFPFQRKIAFYGMFNSLSQILLKITSPGVPDNYQGTELWDFSMVRPR